MKQSLNNNYNIKFAPLKILGNRNKKQELVISKHNVHKNSSLSTFQSVTCNILM